MLSPTIVPSAWPWPRATLDNRGESCSHAPNPNKTPVSPLLLKDGLMERCPVRKSDERETKNLGFKNNPANGRIQG